jgi:hypothetical protein
VITSFYEQEKRDRERAELEAVCARALSIDAARDRFFESPCWTQCWRELRRQPAPWLVPMGYDDTVDDLGRV